MERRKRERAKNKSWYKDWLSTSRWVTTLLPSILGPFIGLLLLISFGPWAFNRLTGFIKQQIDTLIAKPSQVHYHRLAMEDSDGRPGFQLIMSHLHPGLGGHFQQALSWC